MKNNEWDEIGIKIRDTVQSAIDSRDFKQLSKNISHTVNSALDSMRTGMQSPGSGQRNSKQHPYSADGCVRRESAKPISRRGRTYPPIYRKSPPYNTAVFARRPAGSIAGPLWASLGFSFMGLFLILAFSFLMAAIFSFGTTALGYMTVTAVMAVLSLGGFGSGMRGVIFLKRLKRFRRYAQLIGEQGYYEINQLAQKTGKSRAYVMKDLNLMIQKGMFLNGHIDQQQSYLIVTPDAYSQYLNLQEEQKRKKDEETLIAQKQEENKISDECQKILAEGKAYIHHIHACNEALPGEEISDKLYRLEEIIKRIFSQVEDNPQLAPELHKFMSYYLPTTSKLIDTYRELDNQPAIGENIVNTKREIEDTLDTINVAFEKLLDRFFQGKAWDISADISVMKTMLAQEGLTGSDFKMQEDEKGGNTL